MRFWRHGVPLARDPAFGWIGVQTFFVLSGFLITGILERSKERYSTLDYFFVFEWRRFLRICPAYFGYLGVLALLFLITRQPDSLPQWLGRISYGLYLFHLPVQSLLKPFIAGKPWFAPESLCLFLVSILATVFVAWLSYEFCEVHFLKLKNLYKPKPVCYRDVATNLSQG
jgi:peptidoglycan/LPS O-acetylase OafA/YrhL